MTIEVTGDSQGEDEGGGGGAGGALISQSSNVTTLLNTPAKPHSFDTLDLSSCFKQSVQEVSCRISKNKFDILE